MLPGNSVRVRIPLCPPMKTKCERLKEKSEEILARDKTLYRTGADARFIPAIENAKDQQANLIEKKRLAAEGHISKPYYGFDRELTPYKVNITYVSKEILDQECRKAIIEGWTILIDKDKEELLLS